MNQRLASQVRRRAHAKCEYCHLPALAFPLSFHVDHIIAQQHGGETVLDNLAFACLNCNRHKGPNIAGRDPVTGEIVRLFHPRQDPWTEHFEWAGPELTGKTAIGRATINVLAINAPECVMVRESLIAEQVFFTE